MLPSDKATGEEEDDGETGKLAASALEGDDGGELRESHIEQNDDETEQGRRSMSQESTTEGKHSRGVSFSAKESASTPDRRKSSPTREPYTSSSSSGTRTADLGESVMSTSSSGFSFSLPRAVKQDPQKARAELKGEWATQKSLQRDLLKHLQHLKSKGKQPGSFEELLTDFGELSKQLTKAISNSQRMVDENEELVRHYERLKAEHLKLRAKYVDSRRMVIEETETRLAMEQHHEEQISRWRRQLEMKAREFDELQIQLSLPGDMNLVQAKVKQEVEGVHRAQLAIKEKEVEKYKRMYFSEHNTLELLRTEFEQFTENQARDSETKQAAAQAQIEILRSQIDQLAREYQETSKQEQIRLRSLEIEKVVSERDILRNKLQNTMKECEELKIKCDQQSMHHNTEIAQYKMDLKEIRVACESLKKKEEARSLDSRRLEDQLETANAKVVQQQSEMSKIRSKVEAAQKALDEERRSCAQKLLEQTSKSDKERHELRAAADTLERKLTLLETKHTEERKIQETTFNSALHQATESKEKLAALLKQAEKSQESLQKEVEDLQVRLEVQARENSEQNDRLRAQQETQAAQLRRAVKEKESLHEKVRGLLDQLRDVRVRADQYQSQATELDKEYRTLQEKHRDLIAQEQSTRVKTERLETQCALLEKDLEKLEAEKLDLRARLEDYHAEMDSLRQQSQDKENVWQRRMAETLYTHTKEGSKAIERLEKKKTSYHSVVEKCKTRIKDLQSRLHEAQNTLATQRHMYQLEGDSLQRRIKELEREREVQTRQISQWRMSSAAFDEKESDDELFGTTLSESR